MATLRTNTPAPDCPSCGTPVTGYSTSRLERQGDRVIVEDHAAAAEFLRSLTFVEYAVRCATGGLETPNFRNAESARRHAQELDAPDHWDDELVTCGPHVVVQRTLSPWTPLHTDDQEAR